MKEISYGVIYILTFLTQAGSKPPFKITLLLNSFPNVKVTAMKVYTLTPLYREQVGDV